MLVNVPALVSQSKITLSHLNDGRVLLAPFHKFVKRQPSILVSVHIPEYFVNSLTMK